MPDYLQYKPVPESGILDAWLTSTNGLTTAILKNLAPGSEHIAIEDIVNLSLIHISEPTRPY